jgi:tRNA(Ile)-lysidine synthase
LNPRDATLERIAARLIEADRLVPAGARVLVAVSGGPDSVALLHFLAAERARSGQPEGLAVGHVNHGLRGAASDEDAAVVRGLAERLGLPHFEARLPEGALREAGTQATGGAPAGSPGALAPEAEARRLRYAALRELAHDAGARLVAVAHTADDQAETVLFRMARGAGLRGLAGMASRARVEGAHLIRPLLDVTREQVLAYLARHGVTYREDESNASLGAARNFLRHEVLPRLRDRVNPAVREALLRESALFREADAYLEAEARRLLPEVLVSVEEGKIALDAPRLCGYPKLLRSYIFRCALHDLDGVFRELSSAHVDVLHSLATQSSGRAADFPMGIHARRERQRIILTCRNREPASGNVDPTKEASEVETSGIPADSRKGSPA